MANCVYDRVHFDLRLAKDEVQRVGSKRRKRTETSEDDGETLHTIKWWSDVQRRQMLSVRQSRSLGLYIPTMMSGE